MTTVKKNILSDPKKFNPKDIDFSMSINIGIDDILRLLAEHDPTYAGLCNIDPVLTDVYSEDDKDMCITFEARR